MRLVCKEEHASVLILTLFVCLATMVVLQAAGAAILCAHRAVFDEGVGRQRLKEKDAILGLLRERSSELWGPTTWMALGTGEGMMELPSEGEEWLLLARARQESSLSIGETAVLVERARDGLDLPKAAIVADRVAVSEGRTAPWLSSEEEIGIDGSPAADSVDCFLGNLPQFPLLGPGCVIVEMADSWGLSSGWAAPLFETGVSSPGVGHNEQVFFLAGRVGLVENVATVCRGGDPSAPGLVVMTGGGTLDARNLGDFWGVLVADGGSMMLEGTTVHGAVFASDTLDLGMDGRVLFTRGVLRWATDRSLTRTRLVPGTRWEGGMD